MGFGEKTRGRRKGHTGDERCYLVHRDFTTESQTERTTTEFTTALDTEFTTESTAVLTDLTTWSEFSLLCLPILVLDRGS